MMKMFKTTDRRGMTLVELVVVVAVLSVLASVAMPVYRASLRRTKEAALRRDLREMRDAIDYYKKLSDEGMISKDAGSSGYPKTLDVLVAGVQITNPPVVTPGTPSAQKLPAKMRFLRKVPVDPMTGKDDWGKRSNEDEPDSSSWGGQDVFDVYSQSDGIAMDGTKYKDW
jgi:general secretion pathway protein G